MKLKHSLLAVALLFSGSAFSQISNQFTNAQTSANAWISGIFRANTGFELNATDGTGGFLLYNSGAATGDISGKLRWVIRGQNAESGSNAGFNLAFIRRNDAGAALDAPLTLMRQTGEVVMPGVVSMGANSTVTNFLKIKGTGAGAANSGWIAFYENDNTTRVGYIGDGASGNNSIYLAADVGGIFLTPATGEVGIASASNRGTLVYSNTPASAPTFATRSVGTKTVWHQMLAASQADFASGMETSNSWNSVPTNSATYGFKWYGGTTQVARLDGTGNFETLGLLSLGTSGSERLSARFNALGFNRNVNSGVIFSNTGHAYQFTHTASATAVSDRFDLQVYNPAGTAVTATAFSVNGAGNIGIGVTPRTNYKLAVAGDVAARKIKVTQETWADYVFKPGYKLPTIAETEAFINANKHLPGIPSEKEITKDGIDVGEMNKLLLQKIEEQMLYIIEMNKEIKALKEEVKVLKND